MTWPGALTLEFGPPPNREPGWPHLYFGSILRAAIERYEFLYLAHEEHRSNRPQPPPAEPPHERINELIDEVDVLTRRLDPWFEESVVFRAFGQGSHSPDEQLIQEITRGIVGAYGALILWAQRVRDTPVPNEWVPVYDAIAEMADGPIRQVRRFALDWWVEANDYVRALRAGRQPMPLTVTLKLKMTDVARTNFRVAARKLKTTLDQRGSAGITSG